MSAGDRTKKIVSRVRLRLGEKAVSNIQDEEFIDFGNEIQIDMMVRLRCNEILETIDLSIGENSYELENYQGRIKKIITSWENGKVEYVDNSLWNYTSADTGTPCYCTIFANLFYLAPSPAESGSIDLWIHNKMYTKEMSKTYDPETPAFLDMVLELGILSIYDPAKWKIEYEAMIRDYSPTTHQKQNTNLQPKGDWEEG